MRPRSCMTVLAVAVLVPLVAGPRSGTGAEDRGDARGADTRATGTIAVTMTGFRSDKGLARVALFGSKEGFPGDHRRAVRSATVRIVKGGAAVTFENVPHATYAIAVLHDENGNGKMDTNALGMPKEGAGVSNDAKSRFGPPKFDDAKFVLRAPSLALRIAIRYL